MQALEANDQRCVFLSELISALAIHLELPELDLQFDPTMKLMIQHEIAWHTFRQCMLKEGIDPQHGLALSFSDVFETFCKCNGQVFEREFTCYQFGMSETIWDSSPLLRFQERLTNKEDEACIGILELGYKRSKGSNVGGHAVALVGAQKNSDGSVSVDFRDPYFPDIVQTVTLSEFIKGTGVIKSTIAPMQPLFWKSDIQIEYVRGFYVKCPVNEESTKEKKLED